VEIRYAESGEVSLAYAVTGESTLPGFSFRDAGTPELKGLGPRRLLAVQAP